MQHFTTTKREQTITRLDGEETHLWKTEDPSFRARVIREAVKFATVKDRDSFKIEAETDEDGTLYEGDLSRLPLPLAREVPEDEFDADAKD